MINKNTTSKIQTVLGPIDPEKLGVTLTHEHLLWDPTEGFSPPSEASMRDVYYKPLVTDHPGYPETLSLIRHATGNVNIDNCSICIKTGYNYKNEKNILKLLVPQRSLHLL